MQRCSSWQTTTSCLTGETLLVDDNAGNMLTAIRYMKNHNFAEAAESVGATMKKDHTIVEKWPFRVKLRPGQPGAQEEFDRLLRDRCLGQECFVEWKRVEKSATDETDKTDTTDKTDKTGKTGKAPGMPKIGKLAI